MPDLLELYQTGGIAQRLMELDELARPTLVTLAETLGYRRAFVALADAEHGSILGGVGENVPEQLLDRLATPANQPGPLIEALRESRPLRIDDPLRDPRIPEAARPFYLELGPAGFAVIPLPPASCVLVVTHDEPIGEADLNRVLVYAGRIMTGLAGQLEAQRRRASDDQQAIDKEWLWWALNSVPDPIVLANERNEVLLHNIPAKRLFSAKPDDRPGRRRAIELNNVLLSAAVSSLAPEQETIRGRELTLVDPIEGDELLFEVITRPATNLRTGETGTVSVLKNVTDLRRAAEEVRTTLAELGAAREKTSRERDRLNLILDNVPNPIVVSDPDGQIILMNQPAERLLQPRDDSLGSHTTTIYRANTKFTSFLAQFGLDAAQVRRGEIDLTDPDTGAAFTMSVSASEVRDELGTVTAVVSVLHDLTQLRELERRTLEHQLFESEKLAALGRLAATVAHEINNPLEAIINSLHLVLTHTPEGDPNRRYLEIASKETQRVSGIIRQMLGLSRPAAAMTPTDLNSVVQETLALLERQLRSRRINVQTRLDPQLTAIAGSGDQLKQVVLNLILNAQDAMPNGGTLSVTSRLSRATDTDFLAGRYVLLQIQDTGHGITDDDMQHIFEPFYSTKRQGGSGLGLWVSSGIVQNHGGSIRVRNRSGQGTTFTVALPAVSPQ